MELLFVYMYDIVIYTKLQNHSLTEKTLLKASPLSVRRIQNNLSTSSDGTTRSRSFDGKKRNSLIDFLPPKQLNTLSPQQQQLTERTNEFSLQSSTVYRNKSNDSGYRTTVPSPSAGQSGDVRKKPPRQHVYEDVERVGRIRAPRHSYEDVDSHDPPTDPISRTKNWVKQHNEIGWSTERQGEEPTGSMWATKNRERAGHSREKKESVGKKPSRSRSPLTSSLPPHTVDHHQDLVSPYHTSTHHASPHHTSTLPHMMYTNRRSTGSSNTLPVGTSISASRRVSYANAITDRPSLLADLPVKESRKERDRADTFTSSDHYSPHHCYHGDDSWKTESYSSYHSFTPSHHHNTPSHHHNHHRRQYSSLQRTTPPSQRALLSRRRSSDTPMESSETRQLSYSLSGHGSGVSLHRTYSSDSPPERGEGPIRGPPTTAGMASNSALKIESYL